MKLATLLTLTVSVLFVGRDAMAANRGLSKRRTNEEDTNDLSSISDNRRQLMMDMGKKKSGGKGNNLFADSCPTCEQYVPLPFGLSQNSLDTVLSLNSNS